MRTGCFVSLARVFAPVWILVLCAGGLSWAGAGNHARDPFLDNEGIYLPPPPSWSPDGKKMAFTANTRAGAVVCVAELASGKVRVLAKGLQPIWSPKGDRIAFFGKRAPMEVRDLYVMPAAGSPPKLVLPGPVWVDESQIAWSPEGRRLALKVPVKGGGQVCVIDASSGKARRVGALRSMDGVHGWISDGREIVVSSENGPPAPGLYAIDARTGKKRLVLDRFVWCRGVSPDGLLIHGLTWDESLGSGIILEAPVSGGEPRIVGDYPQGRNHWTWSVAWKKGVAFGSGLSESDRDVIWRYDLANRTCETLTEGDIKEAAAVVSPDGANVAFYRETDGKSALYVMRTDGSGARLIASCHR